MPLEKVFIHPQAIVDSASIGPGTRVWAFAHVMPGARIGADCNICEHVFIEDDVVLGDQVTVKSGVYIWNGISIEDKVFVGPNATFTNDRFPRSKAYQAVYPRTLIRRGASLGAACVLIAGVTVGRYAMVGAGAVVTKDVPDYALVFGNPAHFQGWICTCGKRLRLADQQEATCPCGLSYRLVGGRIESL
ncbi:MAG: N-acetyltransferase [Desulfarculus sp.]|jgi:acetyltransferase-like isoleucine patch superfamily enzyme|nr:MAG: N-acetyltransferase [Desulfarculus sp.]